MTAFLLITLKKTFVLHSEVPNLFMTTPMKISSLSPDLTQIILNRLI